MKRYTSSKSSLFLMELILSIFLFMLASVVCVQLFVKAHQMNQDAQQRNETLFRIQSVAEYLRGGDSAADRFLSVFPGSVEREDGFSLYYDENWEDCSEQDASYQMDILINRGNSDETSELIMRDIVQKKTIYQMELAVHIPYQKTAEKGEE